jgi:hypothetical protein
LAIDPNNPETMYASVVHYGGIQGKQQGGIYRTKNLSAGAGSTWTKLPDPPGTEGHPACIEVLSDGKMVCTFSGRINPSGAFTPSSGVFLFDPVSDTWSNRTDAGMRYWCKDIVIDPSDPSQNTWFVGVFSGWGGAPNGLGGLYKTVNRGATWSRITGSQFDRVTSLTFNPQNNNQAYLTTETQGLWYTANIHEATVLWNLVDSYPFRQPERVFFNPFNNNELWITSFGNGMKVGYLNASGITENTLPEDRLLIFPVPFHEKICFSSPKSENRPERAGIYNIQGQLLINSEYGQKEINTSILPAGVYILELETREHQKEIRKIVKY